MKKLFFSLCFFMLASLCMASNIYVNAGLGYGITDKAKSHHVDISGRGTQNLAKEIGLEITQEVYPNVEVGGGIAYQLLGEPKSSNHGNVKYQLPEVSSVPFYLTTRYSKNLEDYKVFAKIDLGYSINSSDNDAKVYINNYGGNYYCKYTNGFYGGAGVGVEKNNVSVSLMYKVNTMKVKTLESKSNMNSHRVMLMVGYKI